MDEFDPTTFGKKETSDILQSDLLTSSDAPLLDMDGFETLEASINAGQYEEDVVAPGNSSFGGGGIDNSAFDLSGFEPKYDRDILDPQPATKIADDFQNIMEDFPKFGDSKPELSPIKDVGESPGFGDTRAEEETQMKLSIGAETLSAGDEFSFHHSSVPSDDFEIKKDTSSKSREPKIEADDEPVRKIAYEPEVAYEPPPAQTVHKATRKMEEKTANSGSECECPFSPAAWFNKEKLDPNVAKYVYWEDPKKSGVALGVSLVLLLSFKYLSIISVIAYLTIALLVVTLGFWMYKNAMGAIQKSNEGHPFKDYLDMDISLSQGKVSETAEMLIQHVNCTVSKLRSLVLVEHFVDTIKLLISAWLMTWIGAWFNGLTLIILAVVSAFTLPKVYETNKAQIDMYTDIVRTKVKEVLDMVNAKMPLGKKKKDQ